MTIEELANLTECTIQARDGKDGKILFYRYRPQKHGHLANREILSIWADIDVFKSGFSCRANPIICVYVEHRDGERQ